MSRPAGELVAVVCTHGQAPKQLGRVLPGAVLWHPKCCDERGRMRPHKAPEGASA